MKEGDYLNEIIKNTVEREGGYVNHSADKGGPTRYGITESVARKNGYNGDMRDFPLEKAVEIYKSRYWDSIQLDKFDDERVQELIFDAGVNHGTKWGIRLAQRAYNTLNKQVIAEDGIVGPRTINAINSYSHKYYGKEPLLQAMIYVRAEYYRSIVEYNNSQKSFIVGWYHRLEQLRKKVL
jgi:lysozyme family protein